MARSTRRQVDEPEEIEWAEEPEIKKEEPKKKQIAPRPKDWNVESLIGALNDSLVGEVIHSDTNTAVIEIEYIDGKRFFDIIGWNDSGLFHVRDIIGVKQLSRKLNNLDINTDTGWIPIEWSSN